MVPKPVEGRRAWASVMSSFSCRSRRLVSLQISSSQRKTEMSHIAGLARGLSSHRNRRPLIHLQTSVLSNDFTHRDLFPPAELLGTKERDGSDRRVRDEAERDGEMKSEESEKWREREEEQKEEKWSVWREKWGGGQRRGWWDGGVGKLKATTGGWEREMEDQWKKNQEEKKTGGSRNE